MVFKKGNVPMAPFKKGNKLAAGRPLHKYQNHKEHYKGKRWFNSKLKKYLKERKDEEYEFHKTRGNTSDSYEEKVKVKLPTVEGFASYIGFTKSTVYNWAKKKKKVKGYKNPVFIHPEVQKGIEKIMNEQLTRLIDRGLEGTYSSTIAKLMLSSNHGMREKSDVTTDDNPIPLLDYTVKKE